MTILFERIASSHKIDWTSPTITSQPYFIEGTPLLFQIYSLTGLRRNFLVKRTTRMIFQWPLVTSQFTLVNYVQLQMQMIHYEHNIVSQSVRQPLDCFSWFDIMKHQTWIVGMKMEGDGLGCLPPHSLLNSFKIRKNWLRSFDLIFFFVFSFSCCFSISATFGFSVVHFG